MEHPVMKSQNTPKSRNSKLRRIASAIRTAATIRIPAQSAFAISGEVKPWQ
jgi:hypothetical protein